MPSRSNVAMFGKDLSVDGMLMHSAEFCLPSPCYCPAAFAEQEGRQLLRWQDQPEQMLRRCSNDDSKGISHIPCKFQKSFWGNLPTAAFDQTPSALTAI